MKFDRNTVLGFLILGALFIGYFVYTSKEQNAYRKKQVEAAKIKREQDVKDSLRLDSLDLARLYRGGDLEDHDDRTLVAGRRGLPLGSPQPIKLR